MECFKSAALALVLFAGLVLGEVVKVNKCHLPKGRQSTCEVHEVRISPCPEAALDKPCKLSPGVNATLSFDYTPTFSAEKVGSHAYKVGSVVDVAWEQMDTNGCLYTSCPVEAGKRQVYNYNLQVTSQFPATTHTVKWKLWDEKDYHDQCCFKFALQLTG